MRYMRTDDDRAAYEHARACIACIVTQAAHEHSANGSVRAWALAHGMSDGYVRALARGDCEGIGLQRAIELCAACCTTLWRALDSDDAPAPEEWELAATRQLAALPKWEFAELLGRGIERQAAAHGMSLCDLSRALTDGRSWSWYARRGQMSLPRFLRAADLVGGVRAVLTGEQPAKRARKGRAK